MKTVPEPYFISTSIPYVNGKPHIGHAMEYVLSDAVARSQRLYGADVWFTTGSDENSLKNVQAAEREGLSVAALVARNAARFQKLADQLATSYDSFLRTSIEPRHAAGVRRLWDACAANGDIYRGSYRGLYCVGCEQFYTEAELVDGLCPEHLTAPEVIEEENFFFRLSRYAAPLLALIESDRLRVLPAGRKSEVLSFIRGGLTDLSISRSKVRARGWGIPTPGDPDQVVYVWFDALANYITVLDYVSTPDPAAAQDGEPVLPDDGSTLYRRYWAGNPSRVHVIGKGILRFHAVYWPAFLLSAGLPLPTTILVHGYLTVDGQKISKSLGNAIDPTAIVAACGTDALRYFLLRHTPAADDSDFTQSRLVHAYNAELADQLGNLLSRTVSMVARYYDGVIPQPGVYGELERPLRDLVGGLGARVQAAVEHYVVHEALAAIWEVIGTANKYVVEAAPWVVAKTRARGDVSSGERLATMLYVLLETLRVVAVYLQPFLPQTAVELALQLGITGGLDQESRHWGGLASGTRVHPGPALFPKTVTKT